MRIENYSIFYGVCVHLCKLPNSKHMFSTFILPSGEKIQSNWRKRKQHSIFRFNRLEIPILVPALVYIFFLLEIGGICLFSSHRQNKTKYNCFGLFWDDLNLWHGENIEIYVTISRRKNRHTQNLRIQSQSFDKLHFIYLVLRLVTIWCSSPK